MARARDRDKQSMATQGELDVGAKGHARVLRAPQHNCGGRIREGLGTMFGEHLHVAEQHRGAPSFEVAGDQLGERPARRIGENSAGHGCE